MSAAPSVAVTRVAPDWLVEAIDGKRRVLVVDARETDERQSDGWIPNSLNLPVNAASEGDLRAFLSSNDVKGAEAIVSHCALSQVRGPRLANSLAALAGRDGTAVPPIHVLADGNSGWQRRFASARPDLCAYSS